MALKTSIVQMISYNGHLYAFAKHEASKIPQVSSIGQWGVLPKMEIPRRIK